jgi:DNA-binding transcriptional ArsR family regulator
MPRAATTADVFNAIAEPRRRQIIDILAKRGALAVGALVLLVGLPQPAVSKHLGVLRKVGIVSALKQGQQRLYQLEAKELKPVHDWVKTFEQYWAQQLDRIKLRAEKLAKANEQGKTKKG